RWRAGVDGRGLRAGADGAQDQRSRRRPAPGQRHAVRSGLLDLDRQHGGRAPRRAGARGGLHVGELDRHRPRRAALRRHQAVRIRQGARGGGVPAVHRGEVGRVRRGVRGGLAVVGAIILLAGAVFAGQGLGYIPGSYMTGDIKWFWIGTGMVVRGLVVGGTALFLRPASPGESLLPPAAPRPPPPPPGSGLRLPPDLPSVPTESAGRPSHRAPPPPPT